MACDRCGARATELATVLDIYQTEMVKCICPVCKDALNDYLSDLRGVTSRWTRRKMKKFLGGTYEDVPKPGLLTRICNFLFGRA
jgi:hypothetical protein